MTHWSLAGVRPEKKRRRDFRRLGRGPGVDEEKVGVSTEGLMVVNIRCDIFTEVNEPVYHVVQKKFVREGRLEVVLGERQNLVEVFPGDARISYSGPLTTLQQLTAQKNHAMI